MKITQKQVAERAGVSQTAVSMILNHRGDMSFSEECRERVFRTARELGYFRQRRMTRNLGVVPPSMSTPERYTESTFHSRFFNGATFEARQHGYHLILEGWRKPERLPDMVTEAKIDGVICHAQHPLADIMRLHEAVPVVLLNYEAAGAGITSIMPDNRAGMAVAVRHLYDNGHRRIGYVGTTDRSLHYRERQEAFKANLRALGLRVRKDYVWFESRAGRWKTTREQLAEEAVDHFLRLPDPPTALVGQNDCVLLPLLPAARARGWSIPDRLSVVGVDNERMDDYADPPLSSIDQPLEEMGRTAVQELVALLENPNRIPRHLTFDVRLVRRGSVASPSAG
ncbi:MAG: LacI family DNA-binding transcriptional regulator [Kiritimatiellae bacterium]|nr:LacI family DNA-binding transcriptional regulator [Kiritimatiellia bacterium]